MNTRDLYPAAIALRKGEIHHVHRALGRRVEALDGCLWITMDNDLRDIVVNPGEAFRIDRGGDTLISALNDSHFVLLDPSE